MNKPIGLRAYRLQPLCNDEEIAFVEQWHQEHEWGDLLKDLFSVPGKTRNSNTYPIGVPIDRDYIIAETIIQWLGTAVGLGIIKQVLKRVGKQIM